MKMIVFVCTGNTCRSPMAEGIFNTLARDGGIECRAESCGIFADAGAPASREAVTAAAVYGADISGHTARPVSEALVEAADAVYCMTAQQTEQLRTVFPAHEDKIKDMPGGDIPDPYGGTDDVYAVTAERLCTAVKLIAEGMK